MGVWGTPKLWAKPQQAVTSGLDENVPRLYLEVIVKFLTGAGIGTG